MPRNVMGNKNYWIDKKYVSGYFLIYFFYYRKVTGNTGRQVSLTINKLIAGLNVHCTKNKDGQLMLKK